MKKWMIGMIGLLAVLLVFVPKTAVRAADHEGAADHCLCLDQPAGIDSRANHQCASVSWQEWTSTTTLPISGSYYLGADVTVTANTILAANATLNLCLNGHTISAAVPTSGTMWRVFGLQTGSVLNITDCSSAGTGKIVVTGGTNSSSVGTARGFIVCNTNSSGTHGSGSGKCNLYRGTLDASGAKSYMGSAAYVYGTFNMYGGTIKGGSGIYGGNINVNGGTFNMYGGTVSGGKGVLNGGSYADGGNFFVQGGAKLNLYAGTVKDGTAELRGGNLYMEGASSITIDGGTVSGGKVTGTKANMRGGNIYLQNGTLTIKSGTVSGGSAAINNTSAGGNIAVTGSSTKVVMSGGTIESGVSTYRGGNVFMDQSTCTFTLTGGTITGGTIDNAASNTYTRGGNIAVNNGKLYIQGGTVTEGKVLSGSWTTGGNISVQGANSRFEMTAGTVEKGTAGQGGNLMFYSNTGSFISGGTIRDGVATNAYGGNILLHQGVSFTIKGTAKILNGTAVNVGGNITIGSETSGGQTSTLTIGESGADNTGILISGGVAGIIKKNGTETVNGGYGGNIGIGENAGTIENKLIMYGGTVSNGSAIPKSSTERGYGGNIGVNEYGYMEIHGGTITGGSARQGSNIWVDCHASASLTGGTISDPKASSVGGNTNVFLNITGSSQTDSSTFTMSGGTITSTGTFHCLEINGNFAEYYNGHATVTGGTLIAENGRAIRNNGFLTVTGGYVQGTVYEKASPNPNALEPVSTELSGGYYSVSPSAAYVAAGYAVFLNSDPVYLYKIAAGGLVETTSSVESGDMYGVGAISGGGAYAVGDTITLTAPDVPGYTFVHWMEGTTEIGTNKTETVRMTAAESRLFEAVYRFGAEDGFMVTVVGITDYDITGVVNVTGYPAGSLVTVNYLGTDTFNCWKNESGKVVSRDASYSFVIANDVTLTAVLASDTDRPVVFYNYYSQVVKMKSLTAGASNELQDADFTALPAITGKKNGQWKVKGTAVTTKAELLAAAGDAATVDVRASYEDDLSTTITLTVTGKQLNGTALSDYADGSKVYAGLQPGALTALSLPDAATLPFLYYADTAGKPISRTADMSVRFYGDAELYAVYGNETAPDGPLVSVLTIKRTGTTMNVEVLRDLPDGYSVKEQGILFGTEATFGILDPEDAMVFNGADTFRYVSNGIAPTDVTGLTLRNVSGKIYARGYVIYLFGGAEAVIYTGVVSVE